MFERVLIANRGEVACRIVRTLHRMGLVAIAVHSEADAGALHVAMADAAYLIGPAPARDSYLRIDRVIGAARASGAQAIHPGYGFLSENADFADACAEAGIVFIGPPASAIRAMGSKAAARAAMERAGVPVTPGYHGDDQDIATLRDAAARIGFPVLIKASAGGGGRGIRVVPGPDAMADAVTLARSEARAAFCDDRLLIERYLTRPRHVEVQVFADRSGETVHLFDRDCSIQRRHQKVIEEAPAPGLTAARREAMGDVACAAARAVGYVGAGTVEFIVEGGDFYFMEMNTRLQVEHAVTEAITGQDLVEWQLRVAAGEALPLRQHQISVAGHAIEARLYAEDPWHDFAPGAGTISHLEFPREDRVDTGVRAGDAVTVHYDPMIAKLIVHGADRAAAVRRLSRAMERTEIAGVPTNLGLLRAIAAHPAFVAADLDTGFIARHAETLLRPPPPAPPAVLAAAIHCLLEDAREAAERAADPADPHSPWAQASAWRLNGDGFQDFSLREGEATHVLRAHPDAHGFRLDLPDGPVRVEADTMLDGRIALRLDGATSRVGIVRTDDDITVFQGGAAYGLTHVDPRSTAATAPQRPDRIVAPMPGRVVEVRAVVGQAIERGALLVTMEAMKVQMRLVAPADGVIAAVRCAVGDVVAAGMELVILADRPP